MTTALPKLYSTARIVTVDRWTFSNIMIKLTQGATFKTNNQLEGSGKRGFQCILAGDYQQIFNNDIN